MGRHLAFIFLSALLLGWTEGASAFTNCWKGSPSASQTSTCTLEAADAVAAWSPASSRASDAGGHTLSVFGDGTFDVAVCAEATSTASCVIEQRVTGPTVGVVIKGAQDLYLRVQVVTQATGATLLVLGGSANVADTGGGGGGASDAADLTYTPADLTDWNLSTDPGDGDDALDQLGDRTKTLETEQAVEFIDSTGAPSDPAFSVSGTTLEDWQTGAQAAALDAYLLYGSVARPVASDVSTYALGPGVVTRSRRAQDFGNLQIPSDATIRYLDNDVVGGSGNGETVNDAWDSWDDFTAYWNALPAGEQCNHVLYIDGGVYDDSGSAGNAFSAAFGANAMDCDNATDFGIALLSLTVGEQWELKYNDETVTVSGTVGVGSGANTLVANAADFAGSNDQRYYFVRHIQTGDVRQIESNDTTTLTLDATPAWSVTPVNTDTYEIFARGPTDDIAGGVLTFDGKGTAYVRGGKITGAQDVDAIDAGETRLVDRSNEIEATHSTTTITDTGAFAAINAAGATGLCILIDGGKQAGEWRTVTSIDSDNQITIAALSDVTDGTSDYIITPCTPSVRVYIVDFEVSGVRAYADNSINCLTTHENSLIAAVNFRCSGGGSHPSANNLIYAANESNIYCISCSARYDDEDGASSSVLGTATGEVVCIDCDLIITDDAGTGASRFETISMSDGTPGVAEHDGFASTISLIRTRVGVNLAVSSTERLARIRGGAPNDSIVFNAYETWFFATRGDVGGDLSTGGFNELMYFDALASGTTSELNFYGSGWAGVNENGSLFERINGFYKQASNDGGSRTVNGRFNMLSEPMNSEFYDFGTGICDDAVDAVNGTCTGYTVPTTTHFFTDNVAQDRRAADLDNNTTPLLPVYGGYHAGNMALARSTEYEVTFRYTLDDVLFKVNVDRFIARFGEGPF